MSTLGRPKDKRAAIEADVMRATEELLREGASYSELGVERIATRAGISRSAFYFYFRDKRDLLVRLTEDANRQLVAAADAWLLGEADVRDALVGVGELYRDHGALLRVVVEVSTYDEEIARFWRDLIGRFVAATRARIELEQAAGRALPGPAEPIAFGLIWMTERAFYEQLVQSEPFGASALVDALAAIWRRALYGA